MPLEAVIFDMDGVLTDTVEYHYRSWEQVTGEWGLPFTRQDNAKLLGLTRPASLEVILKGRAMPVEERQRLLARKNEVYLELIEGIGPQDRLPGVLELLQDLARQGVKIGVASGSSNTRLVLEKIEVAGWIQAVVDANEGLRSKPAPDGFLRTAERLGVKPGACVVVEDSPAGVQAAQAAGMCVLEVHQRGRSAGGDGQVRSLEGVTAQTLAELHKKWQAAHLPI